jgi:hypothetical protein
MKPSHTHPTDSAFHPEGRDTDHDFLFISLSDAAAELSRRRRDDALAALHDPFRFSLPANIAAHFTKPRAILFRQLASPTYETLEFLHLEERLNVEPLILEYLKDKFVGANNSYKHALGKMPIHSGMNKHGKDIIRYRTVIDFVQADGKPLLEIPTFTGEPLVVMHHRILGSLTGLDARVHCLDGSDWFADAHAHGRHFYEDVFALCVRDAILFENFHTTEHERTLVSEVVAPAYHETVRRFGVPPLIVRLIPRQEELSRHWDSYPAMAERFMHAEQKRKSRQARLVASLLKYVRR